MPIYVIPILAVISVACVVYALFPGKNEEEDRVKRRMSGRNTGPGTEDLRKKAKESVASKMVERVAPLAVRPVMPKDSAEMSKLRQKLCSAGIRQENASTLFLASKTIVGIIGVIGCIIYAATHGYSMSDTLGLVAFGGGLAFMAPNAWLSSAAAKRKEKVRNGLADSLDLMVISVEAGLALDAALQRVGDELKHVHPELSEEFQITVLESQMGIPRSESLQNMANRTLVDEIRSFVAMINQAERFGTSIARALRNQADSLRIKRRQAAEERAQQCAVKLLFPLILFIFPAIFIVLAGPAALQFMESGI